jgi:hypothetical protein
MDHYPQEAWIRLGRLMQRRRGQLGYGHRQRGAFLRVRGTSLSEKTVARMERGERGAYPESTIGAAEALYGWESGSITETLAGGEPVALEDRQPSRPEDLLQPGDPASFRALAEDRDPHLTPAIKRYLLNLGRREIARIEQEDRDAQRDAG